MLLCLHSSLVRTQCHAELIRAISSAAAAPVMPSCDFTPEPYNGPSYEHVQEIREKNLSPTMKTIYTKPLLLNQGKMQWLWDHKGNRYLDMFGGITTVGVGHCHDNVVASVQKQAARLWHTSNIYMHPAVHEYAEKLTSTMPDNLKVCFLTNSGSEANELAMILSRLYTGNFDILTLRNSYHGGSPYTAGLTAQGTWKHNYANGFGIHHVVNPDPYKGLWGGSRCRNSLVQPDRECACADDECRACDRYLDQLKETIAHSTPNKLAAFFIEPVQGVGGVTQYPKDYMKRAFEVVRAHGGLCVADEVQSGFGRLGSHMWGFETHGAAPDIVTMAKSIGNGFPMGALVTTREVVAAMHGVLHLNTYAGNPLSTTAAAAVLDTIRDERLQANSAHVGAHLIARLATLRDEFACVGDVRGRGLMLGVEMVADKRTRRPLDAGAMMALHERMRDMGVLVGRGGLHGNVLRVKPPMCVTVADADFAFDVLRMAIREYCERESDE